jgi:hypothetical protein
MALPLPSFGTEPLRNQVWNGGLIVNEGPENLTPAELFELDPRLPFQGTMPHPENIDLHYVVIPRGRIVGAVPNNAGRIAEKAWLSLADGSTIKPLGFAPENIFGKIPHREVPHPRFFRAGYIELPYIQAVNDVYGVLNEGDYVTAYYGSTTYTDRQAIEDIGKPVKWVEKRLYRETNAVASGSILLTATASLPGITPRVVMAFTGDGAMVTGAATVTWANPGTAAVAGTWIATFSTSVVSVIYEFGQSVEHRAAQLVRLKQISSTQLADGWLRWVEQNFAGYQYPPMVWDYPTTAVTSETPVADSVDSWKFTLAHNKIAPHKPISVVITSGRLVSNLGVVTALSSTELGLQPESIFDSYTVGEYYRIDFVRGILYLSKNIQNTDGTAISASNIRVSYEYNSRYEFGRSTITGYGVGIRNLTDGANTGLPGTPVHLERAAMDSRFVQGGAFGSGGAFGLMRLTFG